MSTVLKQLASIDFFTVPTLTFRILYVFVVLSHERRRVVHFDVTSHPTAEWTSQQLLQAFPYDTVPQYVLRDRDRIYGEDIRRQLNDMEIEQVLTAPRSPWQTPYVERLIGSIRRDCLDHIVAINEESLRAALRSYFSYYHDNRCHLALDKDSPDMREVQPAERGVAVRSPKWVGFIIATSDAQPDRALPITCQAVPHRVSARRVFPARRIYNSLSILSGASQPILTSHMSPRPGPDALRSARMDFSEGTVTFYA